MALVDLLTIVATSFFFALVIETLSFVIVFNTEGYQKLVAESNRLRSKVDKSKSREGGKAGKKKSAEDELDAVNKSLAAYKMKADGFILAGIQIAVFSIMSSIWSGEAVGVLPFEPFSLLRTLTHHGVPGSNFYDCSYLFIHACGSMVFRSNLSKLFGNIPPKAASVWPTVKQ